MLHGTRASAGARRDQPVVRVEDARRRRQIASARASIRERGGDRDPSMGSAVDPREAAGWFG